MTARLTTDGAGRVVISKPLREELALAPGDTLELEMAAENILLRPMGGTASLTKEKGVWVFRIGHTLPAEVADEVLDTIRAKREAGMRSKQAAS